MYARRKGQCLDYLACTTLVLASSMGLHSSSSQCKDKWWLWCKLGWRLSTRNCSSMPNKHINLINVLEKKSNHKMSAFYHFSQKLALAIFQKFESFLRISTTVFHWLATVACIIVRCLLISVHKWQSSGMADTHEYWSQHDAHLVYLPIFHGLNLIIFS